MQLNELSCPESERPGAGGGGGEAWKTEDQWELQVAHLQNWVDLTLKGCVGGPEAPSQGLGRRPRNRTQWEAALKTLKSRRWGCALKHTLGGGGASMSK